LSHNGFKGRLRGESVTPPPNTTYSTALKYSSNTLERKKSTHTHTLTHRELKSNVITVVRPGVKNLHQRERERDKERERETDIKTERDIDIERERERKT